MGLRGLFQEPAALQGRARRDLTGIAEELGVEG